MTPRRQMIVAVVAGVIVTALFFVFLLRPKMSQIQEVRADVEEARDEEQSIRNDIVRLEQARRTAPRTTAKIATLSRFLPESPDLPGFIRLVQVASVESAIDLRSIAPSPPENLEGSTGIQQISVNLSIRGGFHRVEDFLSRLERLERVVEVRSIALTPGSDALSDATILDGTVTLRMYVVQGGARFSRVRRTTRASPTASPTGGTP